MVIRAVSALSNNILPSRATTTAECSSWPRPASARSCSVACARPSGLVKSRAPSANVWSAPTAKLPGRRIDTESAFSRARSAAMSPGAERLEACCTARSSISAATASNSMPALASNACRARLCEASISGYFPRQRLIAKAASFQQPLPLPIGKQLQHGGCGFLDQSPRERDFIGDGLPIDIVIIAWTGAHAQQPVLPHLDQALRGCVEADDQRLFQHLQLMRNPDARHQRDIRGADAAVGEIDRGWG